MILVSSTRILLAGTISVWISLLHRYESTERYAIYWIVSRWSVRIRMSLSANKFLVSAEWMDGWYDFAWQKSFYAGTNNAITYGTRANDSAVTKVIKFFADHIFLNYLLHFFLEIPIFFSLFSLFLFRKEKSYKYIDEI